MNTREDTVLDRLTAVEKRLLDDFQRDFPLEPTPFASLAAVLGVSEAAVRRLLLGLHTRGLISRVGVVCRPRSLGASTLAAMAVPEHRLEEVAALVNGYREVNHNYEREHRWNLWFVANARTHARLGTVLDDIAARAELAVVSLPMVEDYHIDLGFGLGFGRGVREASPARATHPGGQSSACIRDEAERKLIDAVQSGFPLVPRPYREVGRRIGVTEAEVIGRLRALLVRGVIKRIGVVVRHHELGYRANAMVVWDVPDTEASELGRRLGALECVTLCYRRQRRLPEWPYNLYCMIHGFDRGTVLAQVEEITERCALRERPRQVLFSRRRFKQRGAMYFDAGDEAAAA
ncbi:MAG: Lrp/AsnC family transcriptional regulator [Gammaproteobacteria bacterium]|nr:Lrp/AsnC family transcriptional regulator [Gammaproteobacteria bacterium]NIR83507.1 Lrp/AsnC family transcriptional regulator [Gammaproteobacteria bacterium]NIR91429.1 Lrp/AsnC family transcriptional regulator [Gammaproteobacteria bacterium]NIU04669.1 Lrp/AsnC family transcriptional regulator [Gammaproteobacteria bacterium]NIV51711.1 Lrp/AsnC family transcriptional regulator [Gammaproteobacteria bacterium]